MSAGKGKPSRGDAYLVFWSTARTNCSLCGSTFNPYVEPWGEEFVRHWNSRHAGQPLPESKNHLRFQKSIPYEPLPNDRYYQYLSPLCMVKGCHRFHLPYVQPSLEEANECLTQHLTYRHTWSPTGQPITSASQAARSRSRNNGGGSAFTAMARASPSAATGTAPQQTPQPKHARVSTYHGSHASGRPASPTDSTSLPSTRSPRPRQTSVPQSAHISTSRASNASGGVASPTPITVLPLPKTRRARSAASTTSGRSDPQIDTTFIRWYDEPWQRISCPACNVPFEAGTNSADAPPARLDVLASVHAFVEHWNMLHAGRNVPRPLSLQGLSLTAHSRRLRWLVMITDSVLCQLIAIYENKDISAWAQCIGYSVFTLPKEVISGRSPRPESDSERRSRTSSLFGPHEGQENQARRPRSRSRSSH